MSIKLLYRATFVLTILTAVFGFGLVSKSVFADDSVIDKVSLIVPVSCTVQGTGMDSHTANINNGTYNSQVGITTLKAFCNDNNGFSIHAIGYTDNTYGKNVLASTNLGSGFDIQTGTATSGNSQWAMKLSTNSGDTYPIELQNGFGSFHTVPTQYTMVAKRLSGTDILAPAVGSVLTTTYQVYISANQSADTYVGKVKYTLVHPNNDVPPQSQTTLAGQICYYPNGSGVLGSMGCQTIESSDTSATLLVSNFSREGYGFAGWSTTFDYSDSTGFYGPQEYIEFTAGTYTGQNNGLSLYAHWIKSAGSLQDWSGCSSLQEGAVTALTDQRDNETYAVAKLADGNCWMIENMRLENDTSDNATGALAQGYETGFVGLADPESDLSLFANSTTSNSLYSIDGSTTSTILETSYRGYRFPRYNNTNTPTNQNVSDRPSDPTSNDSVNSTSNAGMYSYGNYYTWAAAAANTTTTSAGNYNTKSICPKGWSLPRGGNKTGEATNDFWILIVTNVNDGTKPANYNSTASAYYIGSDEAGPVSKKIRAYPNNFVYSGYISGGSFNGRGSGGYFWSSTASGNGFAYSMTFGDASFYPGTLNSNKFYGRSIRCIMPSV